LTFLVLIFDGVPVISYSLDVRSETPEETTVFRSEEIEMTYRPRSADGSLGNESCTGGVMLWNPMSNQPDLSVGTKQQETTTAR